MNEEPVLGSNIQVFTSVAFEPSSYPRKPHILTPIPMPILHLHLKFKYYDEIAAGLKTEEYRRRDYWERVLNKKEYKTIFLWRGYTPTHTMFPWRGWYLKTITHPQFGDTPIEVCAIPLV